MQSEYFAGTCPERQSLLSACVPTALPQSPTLGLHRAFQTDGALPVGLLPAAAGHHVLILVLHGAAKTAVPHLAISGARPSMQQMECQGSPSTTLELWCGKW